MKESEISKYNDESIKIEEDLTDIQKEVERINIENERHKDKYDDIYKRLKRTYDNTFKKYEEQRKFLMIEIDQLKNKQKKYASKLRILERLKNMDKNEIIKYKEENKSNNNENQKENSIKEENNISIKNNNNIRSFGKVRKSLTTVNKKREKKKK